MSARTTTGSDRARSTLAYLRRHITTGAWPVGSRIPIEPELTEQIGVGRSTVREAVRSLASIGMLETLPGRGTFVPLAFGPGEAFQFDWSEDWAVLAGGPPACICGSCDPG